MLVIGIVMPPIHETVIRTQDVTGGLLHVITASLECLCSDVTPLDLGQWSSTWMEAD